MNKIGRGFVDISTISKFFRDILIFKYQYLFVQFNFRYCVALSGTVEQPVIRQRNGVAKKFFNVPV
jgi:hypothetical protein